MVRGSLVRWMWVSVGNCCSPPLGPPSPLVQVTPLALTHIYISIRSSPLNSQAGTTPPPPPTPSTSPYNPPPLTPSHFTGGHYPTTDRVTNGCQRCPAGRYSPVAYNQLPSWLSTGTDVDIATYTCSGICPPGSYCPEASVRPIPCPAGTPTTHLIITSSNNYPHLIITPTTTTISHPNTLINPNHPYPYL